mgnify:FL=1|jgi:hypothetical protein|tara:strand:+ start:1047 stop:1277 length:231 start_codon:yes stop_codon:yes gene_type:complete
MLLENLELTLVQGWTVEADVKKKTAKVVVPRAVVGSFKLDFCCSGEALEKLVDVIHDDLFDRDGVTIEISATSRNW